MSWLRSLLFSTPLILLATIVMWTCSMIASLVDRSGRRQHQMARIWARVLLAASFIRVRAEGLEHLDPRANYVFVANHGSYMDIPAVLSTLRYQFRFFAKKGLYRIPFLGWHLKRAGHLPVDRSNARNRLKSMHEGARALAEHGISMLVFPEGGRTKVGLREFKEGAAYIAIKAGVPVAPVAIAGLRECLPMGSIHIRSGQAVIRVGEPIPTAGMKLSQREELTERMHGEIQRLLGEGSGEPRADARG